MKYIISKIQASGETPIGYVESESDMNTIWNNHHYNDYESWKSTNMDGLIAGTTLLSEFFDTTPLVYGGYWKTDGSIPYLLITDLNNPEGA